MMLLDRAPEPWTVLDLDVGEIRLHGFDARYEGKTVEIELHWRVTAKPMEPLTRAIRVTDARGHLAAETSGLALDDLFPAHQWSAGQVVVDRVRLTTGDVFPDRAHLSWERPGQPGASVEISLGLTR
jgi:hypothetical protein